jgi:lysyl-tRNA synthetase class 2
MRSSNWQPTASFVNLKLRAEILAKIRAFFAERNVLEVETPLLSQATVTDINLQSFATNYFPNPENNNPQTFYLQTSPEFAMKRLIAAGSGSIFQIAKAFRNHGESGRLHNPEFSLLEWYRIGFDHLQLMNEVDQLLQFILQTKAAEKLTYADIFWRYIDINPHTASASELKKCALHLGLSELNHFDFSDADSWLQLLMTHYIEPQLGRDQPTFIYDFPMTQAALAKIRNDNPPVAERFEIYVNGVELANGFHELTDGKEQLARFEKDLAQRENLNYRPVPIDHFFLDALHHGLPDCAGVALGIDRLIMLAAKTQNISDVLSFPLEIA